MPNLDQALLERPRRASCPDATFLQILSPAVIPEWDALVRSREGYSFFHGSSWARVLQETYHYQPLYFSAFGEGRLETLVPVMEVDSIVTGRRGISLPFTDFCQPLDRQGAKFQSRFEQITAHGRARRWKYLEFRGRGNSFKEIQPSVSFYGHRLDLVVNEQEMFRRLKSEIRTTIRKAIRAGVEVKLSASEDALLQFYGLHCASRRRHGLPPQPISFFEQIQRHVFARDQGFVAVGAYQGKPIAAAVFLHLGKQAVFKFGASDEGAQRLRGNNLVMWEAIRWYCRHGFDSLHLGRTSIDDQGLRRFKRGWGTIEEPIDYFRYDFRQENFVAVPDGASGWHTRIFTRLPLPVSRSLGALLYKHAA